MSNLHFKVERVGYFKAMLGLKLLKHILNFVFGLEAFLRVTQCVGNSKMYDYNFQELEDGKLEDRCY